MRIVLALLIWVVLAGGLELYMHNRTTVQSAPEMVLHAAHGEFAVEVTTTFPLEPDPFALRVDRAADAPALVVRVNGREVLRRTERVEPGAPILVERIRGLAEGDNELYVEANPPLDMVGRSQAVRVRVLQDSTVIADRSLWSDQGNRIAAVFPVHIDRPATKEQGSHDH